jgi:hypothetical protein
MNSAAAGKNEFPVALSAAELRELRGKGRNVTEIAHEIETLESEALISSRSRRIVRRPLENSRAGICRTDTRQTSAVGAAYL